MRSGKSNNLLASELWRISRLSMEAAELVMPMIENHDFKFQVKHQLETYRAIAVQSAEILERNGLNPNEKTGFIDRILRHSIKIDTSWNKDTSHLAQIAIHCTDAAMKNLVKAMNQSPDDNLEIRKLAEQYLDEAQRDLDSLKKYL